MVPALKELAFERLVIKVRVIEPHAITFRPLFSAYIYLFLAFGLSAALQPQARQVMAQVWRGGLAKGWRASLAMGLFGAMGQMIAFSGYSPGFAELSNQHNVPWLLANGLATYSGSYYPVFVPLLGWVGTFLTGYGWPP